MKAVFDTNIWLSAIFWSGEANKLIEKAESGNIELIITKEILNEMIDVLNKESKFQRFLENRQKKTEDIIRTILSFSTLIKSKIKLNVIKEHQKDNIILEAAIDGKADYIISYDNHILNMLEFREIKILSPQEFLRML
jgi:putative PIN family toxin of toxin-antitoxin system